jgi:hypothetical protein
METIYDKDLMLYFDKKGLIKEVLFNGKKDEIIYKIEEHFVMGYSGIDWENNNVLFSQKLYPENENYIDEIKGIIEKIINSFPNLLKEKVFVIGDSLTNLSYEMDFNLFINEMEQFLLIPQHLYIWFDESKKCINFTFENEVYFGEGKA